MKIKKQLIDFGHKGNKKSGMFRPLALSLCMLTFVGTSAQTGTVSINVKNASVKELFSAIEKQTSYRFSYRDAEIKNKTGITVNVKNEELKSLLSRELAKYGLTYQASGNKIIVTPVKAKAKGVVKKVKGRVVDAKGEPIIGATVMEKGTTNGTITDFDGNFVLDVADGAPLEISYIGYQPLHLVADAGKTLSVTMKEDTEVLDEVVVTALGIKKETKALTYNVQEVKAEELIKVKDANFMNALSGKIAGVTINTASTGTGGAARVVMRGTKSISGNNNAMYVIDGIPVPSLSSTQPGDMYTGMGQSGDGIAAFNPDDIESMSVLTGAAAAALYGSEAANGVVMITTKKGRKGAPEVNISNSTTFSSPFVTPEFQNTYGSETGDFTSWGSKLATPTDYDPLDFFQTGYNVSNSASILTGSDTNQTYLSLGAVNARGIIHNNDMDRYNVTLRNSSSMLNDRLTMDLFFMYMRVNEQNMLAQGQYFNPLVPVYLFPRGDDMRKYQTFERYDASRNFKTQYWPYGDQGMMMQNPYWITERDMFNNKKNRYMFGGSLAFKINDWMNISGRVRYDGTEEVRTKKYYASTLALFAGSDMGAYYKDEIATTQIYADAMLNVDKYIGDFSLKATLGASIRDTQYDYSSMGGPLQSTANVFTYSNLNLSSLRVAQNGYHDQTQAVFATAQVGYKSMAYLDLTGRNDWPSTMGGTKYQKKGFFYPSVGVSAILTEMLPIKSDILPFLKARFSFSKVGNALMRYIPISTYPIENGYPQTTTYLVDPDLKPESTKSYEVGINARLFNNKLNFDLTLYKSLTSNQLFNPTLPSSSGYTSYYVNAGCVENRGIELSVGFDQDLGPVKWNTNVTYSINDNTIKELLPRKQLPTGGYVEMHEMNMGGTDSYRMVLKEGHSMGDIYVNTLKTDEHGYIIVDLISQKVTADPDNFVYAGNANPDYTIGWRNNFEWKGISLGVLVNGRFGGVGVSSTQAKLDYYGVSKASAEARDRGGALVNGQLIPEKDYYQTIGGGTSGIGSMYVYDATNIRLAELSIGYDIPVNKWVSWIKGAHVAFIGRNLLMFYNKAPFDPESTASTGTYFQGIDYFMQPSLRNLGFSVNLKF